MQIMVQRHKKEKKRFIIMGDWNARMPEYGDEKVNGHTKTFRQFLKRNDLCSVNGAWQHGIPTYNFDHTKTGGHKGKSQVDHAVAFDPEEDITNMEVDIHHTTKHMDIESFDPDKVMKLNTRQIPEDLKQALDAKLHRKVCRINDLRRYGEAILDPSRDDLKAISETATILGMTAIHEALIEGHGLRKFNTPNTCTATSLDILKHQAKWDRKGSLSKEQQALKDAEYDTALAKAQREIIHRATKRLTEGNLNQKMQTIKTNLSSDRHQEMLSSLIYNAKRMKAPDAIRSFLSTLMTQQAAEGTPTEEKVHAVVNKWKDIPTLSTIAHPLAQIERALKHTYQVHVNVLFLDRAVPVQLHQSE